MTDIPNTEIDLRSARPGDTIGSVTGYSGLHDVIRRWQSATELTCEQIDFLAGFSGGYSGKLLSMAGKKRFGAMSLECLLQVLGLRLEVVVDRIPHADRPKRRVPGTHWRYGDGVPQISNGASQ